MAARKPREKAPKLQSVDSKAAPGALESGEKVKNYAADKTSDVYKAAEKYYPLIVKAFDNRQEANDNIEEFWSIFNAQPDNNQQYAGNSRCYVPAVRDCVNARAKRKLKQLFPTRHKHVEAVGTDDDTPFAQLALLEHYIRKTGLKDIVRSDLVAGDVTGQWNLYIDWTRSYRRVTDLVKRNPIMQSVDGEEVGLVDPMEEEEATEEKDILEEGPEVVDFATEDLAVVPPTAVSIEKADCVAIRLRMSKEKCEQLRDEGVFLMDKGWEIDDFVNSAKPDGGREKVNPEKKRSNAAGIRTEGTLKYALIYEATARLDFGEEDGGKALAYIYYAGSSEIVGIIKAPQWGGKRPVISAPVERIKGSFYGISKIEPVKYLQWNLNDYWNMGQDSAMYSLLPIVMTDPLKNPNYATMVMGLAAVWATSPNDTKFASFPELYKEALPLCDSIKRQIWESMDVNEMMMGKMPAGRKNNQLMGAMQQEQMVPIMDDAERYESVMLDPLMERMFEYDTQFREKTLTILTKGEVGVKAKMTDVEPQQWGVRYYFQWAGTSNVMGMQRMQQQIAWMNVLRGIPPQQLNGRRLDVTPIIEMGTENVFGPELTPRILIDERNMFTIDPGIENEMMHNGLPVDVHESDDDAKHLEAHQSAARLTADLDGKFRAHMAKHIMSLNAKRQKAMAAQQGQQGAPGGGAQPGMAGSPRMGATPQQPRPGQNPPGAIPQDSMPGAPGRG